MKLQTGVLCRTHKIYNFVKKEKKGIDRNGVKKYIKIILHYYKIWKVAQKILKKPWSML